MVSVTEGLKKGLRDEGREEREVEGTGRQEERKGGERERERERPNETRAQTIRE